MGDSPLVEGCAPVRPRGRRNPPKRQTMSFYTADGDMKPSKPLGKLATLGRSSQIAFSEHGFADDHFRSSNHVRSEKITSGKMTVHRREAPDKNRASEPGVPWSESDYPTRETFTTNNELRTYAMAHGAHCDGRQPICRRGKSEMRIGYKEAEAKEPWKTMCMEQFVDQELGSRKAGPTARAPPKFPPPPRAVNPITGVEKEGRAPIFERYDPEHAKDRRTHDIVYKKSFNKMNTLKPYDTRQRTVYDLFNGTHVVRKSNPIANDPKPQNEYPKPHLSTLGCIRPPNGWNPVTQKIDTSFMKG